MVKKHKYNKYIFLAYIAVLIILIWWCVLAKCNLLYSILLFTWVNMMFYSLNDIAKRISLLCFGIAFFTFLMGRDGMEYLFAHEKESNFTMEVNRHAYISMLIALIGVWLSFHIFNYNNRTVIKSNLNKNKIIYYSFIRKYSLICFYAVYPLAMAVNLFIAYFVIEYGYAAKFTDFRSLIENSPVLYTFTKIELLLPTAFCIYMATLPSKEKFLKLVKSYFIYLLLTLASGGRGDFILGILLIAIFMVFMQQIEPNTIWINKKKLKYVVLFIPIVAIGGSFINSVRFGDDTDDFSLIDAFSDFFYNQGVTGNALKHGYQYESYIPKQRDYYTFEFLHTGIPARLLGNEVYQGNTIEHATKGGSFTHAIGYTVMGKEYLLGRGTGTCYIAELYYDFGYIGILIGSMVYGYIFSLINNFKTTGVFKRSIVFIVITKLLWAPRGGYSGFLSFIFAPTTIGLLLIVFVCAHISYIKYKKNFSLSEYNISI